MFSLDVGLKLDIGSNSKAKQNDNPFVDAIAQPVAQPQPQAKPKVKREIDYVNWFWAGATTLVATGVLVPGVHTFLEKTPPVRTLRAIASQNIGELFRNVDKTNERNEAKPAPKKQETFPVIGTPPKAGSKIAGYRVSSGYGKRPSPCQGCSSNHLAIDVATPVGVPLYAPVATEVTCNTPNRATGLMASFPINDPKHGLQIVRAIHLNECFPGAKQKGEKIATTGDGGTGPHLDYRLKSNQPPSTKLGEALLKKP